MAKMVKTSVNLDPDTALALRAIAQRLGILRAELIRSAVHKLVTKNRRRLPAGAGKFSSGRTDISRNAEAILMEAAKSGRWR